jgi:hypothetical protein
MFLLLNDANRLVPISGKKESKEFVADREETYLFALIPVLAF